MRKLADVTGTHLQPLSAPDPAKMPTKKPVLQKTAFAKLAEQVRAAAASPAVTAAPAGANSATLPQASPLPPPQVQVKRTPPPVEVKTAMFHALGDRYPIDTPEEVKMACDYFEQYHRVMPMEDRRQYALNVAKRAETFHMKTGSALQNYAATTPASEDYIKIAFDLRKQHLTDPTNAAVLDELLEKRASMVPATLVTILTEFDKQAGLDEMYGVYVPDPYNTVFMAKKAEDDLVVLGADTIRLSDLRRYADTHFSTLQKYWGEDFAVKFQKDPQSTFKGLPREQQRVLMRTVNSSLHGSA